MGNQRPTTNANRQDGPLRRHLDTPNEVRSCAWSVLACLLQEHQRDSTSYQRMEIAARCKVPRERPGARDNVVSEAARPSLLHKGVQFVFRFGLGIIMRVCEGCREGIPWSEKWLF